MPLRRREKRTFSERNLTITGVVGTLVVVVVMFAAFNVSNLPFTDHGRQYTAQFAEAGALNSGADVLVSGVVVGSVNSVSLDHGHVKVKFSVTSGSVKLGDATRASIITETLLGKAGLQLDSAGAGVMASGGPIPLSRTTSPYDVTEALSGLTTTVGAISAKSLTAALSTVSGAFTNTPEQLRGALRGVAAIANTISSRDSKLTELLHNSTTVTATLRSRNAAVSTLLSDGNDLLKTLNQKHTEVTELLTSTTAVARQIETLIKTSGAKLKPALSQLNEIVALLNRNKTNLEKTLEGFLNYAGGLGQAISSGPFFDGYIQNLTSPATLLSASPVSSLLSTGSLLGLLKSVTG